MDKAKAKIILFLILSIAIQAINLAGSGYMRSVYSTLDDLHPASTGEPSHIQQNKGNSDYIFAASALSIVIYLYLLGTKIKDTIPSKAVGWFAYVIVNCFQCGIAVTYSIFVTNNLVRFETAMMNYYGLLTVIPTIPQGTIVPDVTPYTNVFSLRSLCTAAAILTFIVCVFGGFYAFYKETHPKSQQAYAPKKAQLKPIQKQSINEIISIQ